MQRVSWWALLCSGSDLPGGLVTLLCTGTFIFTTLRGQGDHVDAIKAEDRGAWWEAFDSSNFKFQVQRYHKGKLEVKLWPE